MCLELMLNGVNLAFIAAGRALNIMDGVIFVFFVSDGLRRPQAAVGLAIFVMIFRLKGSAQC